MSRRHRTRHARPVLVAGLILLLGAGGLGTAPAAGASGSEVVRFAATADTYVDSSRPSTARGSSTGMDVDGKPVTVALLRFDLSGLAGRQVQSLSLRLHQVDASKTGGRVHPVTGAWDESTTWSTRPTVPNTLLGVFGAVSAGRWYELALDPGLALDGPLALALDTTSSDGARWATRESTTRPELVVSLAAVASEPVPAPAPAAADGLSQVAAADRGSSEPTYYGGQHRLAVTRGGRTLALHGLHASGVQLAWRDGGGPWETRSTGDSLVGAVLAGTGTGDWPASLAVATDAQGVESAWVVWSGQNSSAVRPVSLRRVTDLDAPEGPRLGPVVTVDAAPRGAYKADIAFETGADGVVRGCVLYSRRVNDTAYELVATWFSDLAADTPVMGDAAVLETTTSSAHYGSLVPTTLGMRAVTRTGSGGGALRLYAHDAAAPRTAWQLGAAGPAVPSGSSPTATALASGEVVAAVEDDLTAHTTSVYRFAASGTAGEVLLRQSGLAQPVVLSDGARVWLVAVRVADGALVSRTWSADAGVGSEVVEVPAGTHGPLAWPNALRQADGRLRVLFEGSGTSSTRSSVLAYQRPL